MSRADKPGQVVDFNSVNDRADARRAARRQAKASSLRKRFSAARKDSESKTKAVERLKKLFKLPKQDPPDNT